MIRSGTSEGCFPFLFAVIFLLYFSTLFSKSMSVNCVWTYIAKLNILFRQQHGRHFYVMLTVHLFLRMLSEFKIHLGLWLGLTHSLLNSLEDVLSGLEDADNVARNCEFVQRIILKEVLGDGCSAIQHLNITRMSANLLHLTSTSLECAQLYSTKHLHHCNECKCREIISTSPE